MTAGTERARRPDLSVVVVVFAGGRTIARALQALRCQEGAGAVEIIVAGAQGMVDEDAVRRLAPNARLVRGPVGAHPAQLRALGVAVSAAAIVACTEDHCIPTPDWCARIRAAHAGPAPVIGGAIQKLKPDSAIAWAAFLLEYGRFMPPVANGPVQYVSDCNVSYKRSALDAIAGVWQAAFHETSVHGAIRERGGPAAIMLDASIVVLQSRHPDPISFFRERFDHGRLFARLRASHFGAGARLGYAAASLGLAPVLVVRALATASRRPGARWSALRALPYLTLAAASWSAGESVGALTAGRRRANYA